MSTRTSTTGKISTSTPTDSTVRPGLRAGEQVVAVQFAVSGPQEVTVRAYSDGGRGGAPYVAVGVGSCLRRPGIWSWLRTRTGRRRPAPPSKAFWCFTSAA